MYAAYNIYYVYKQFVSSLFSLVVYQNAHFYDGALLSTINLFQFQQKVINLSIVIDSLYK